MKIKLFFACLVALISIKLSEQYGTKGGAFSGSYSSSASASQSSSYSSSSSGSFSGSFNGEDGTFGTNLPSQAFAGSSCGGTGKNCGSLKNVAGNAGAQVGAFAGSQAFAGGPCVGKSCGVKTAGSYTSFNGGTNNAGTCGGTGKNCGVKPIGSGAVSGSVNFGGKIPENIYPVPEENKVTFTKNEPKSELPGIYSPNPVEPEPDSVRYEINTSVPPLIHNSVANSNSGSYGNSAIKDGTTKKQCCSGPFPGPTGSIHDKKPASSVPPIPSQTQIPQITYPVFTNTNVGTTSKAPGPFPGPSGSIHDSKPASSVPAVPAGPGVVPQYPNIPQSPQYPSAPVGQVPAFGKPVQSSNFPTYAPSVPSGGSKPQKTQCCKGPFPGPTGSIHEGKPASSVPQVPGHVPVQSGSYGNSGTFSGSTTNNVHGGVQPPCCQGPFPGPGGSIHQSKPAGLVPVVPNQGSYTPKPSFPTNKPSFGYFGSTNAQSSGSAGSSTTAGFGGYYNKPQVGTNQIPDKTNVGAASRPIGEQPSAVYFEPNSGSYPSTTVGNVITQKPVVPNQPNYGSSYSTSGTTAGNYPSPNKPVVPLPNLQVPYNSGKPTNENHDFAIGTINIYKPDGTTNNGKDTPLKPSDSVGVPTNNDQVYPGYKPEGPNEKPKGPTSSTASSGSYGSSDGFSTGTFSNYKPDGTITSGTDRPVSYPTKTSSGTIPISGSATSADGFATGSVSITKPDGTITSGNGKPVAYPHSPSGTFPVSGSSSSADGFATGTVAIYKPDGTITSGNDKPTTFPKIPTGAAPGSGSYDSGNGFATGSGSGGSYSSTGTTSNYNPYGTTTTGNDKPSSFPKVPTGSGSYGSSDGFATGNVAIQKPDGTITNGIEKPTAVTSTSGSYGSSGSNTNGFATGTGPITKPDNKDKPWSSGDGYVGGSVSVYKPDGTITSGNDKPTTFPKIPTGTAPGSGSYDSTNGFATGNGAGGSYSSTGTISNYNPYGTTITGNDKPSSFPKVPTGSGSYGSSDGFATGNVAIQKPDGTVTNGVDKPTAITSTSGSYGSSGSSTNGFATETGPITKPDNKDKLWSSGDGYVDGSLSIYKPDGTITSGKDTPYITKTSADHVAGLIFSGAKAFAGSGVKGGFGNYEPTGFSGSYSGAGAFGGSSSYGGGKGGSYAGAHNGADIGKFFDGFVGKNTGYGGSFAKSYSSASSSSFAGASAGSFSGHY